MQQQTNRLHAKLDTIAANLSFDLMPGFDEEKATEFADELRDVLYSRIASLGAATVLGGVIRFTERLLDDQHRMTMVDRDIAKFHFGTLAELDRLNTAAINRAWKHTVDTHTVNTIPTGR